MGHPHHSRRGSMAYSPRKRAASPIARIASWPEIDGEPPRLQGFAGYKAGMTHAIMVDSREHSTTSGMEIQVPVTVVETPPMKIAGIRAYQNTHYGLQTIAEVWAAKLDKPMERKLTVQKEGTFDEDWKALLEKASDIEEIRAIAYTQPELVTGVPKKSPELLEINVGGGTIAQRLEYIKGLFGKDIKIGDYAADGMVVDVAAITKGKGFQGHVKRWGVKLLSHKNSKHRRMVGTLGPHNPSYILPSVPQAGQMGYHQRTEFNKKILKIGENGEEITPKGGFLHYGVIRNSYILIHGSVPGPAKRLVRLRDPVRHKAEKIVKPDLVYISRESKQGV